MIDYSELFKYLLAYGLGIVLVVLSIFIAILVIYLVGLAKLFEKAKQPGWAAIVPFYNSYVTTKVANVHWMYFLFIMASFIVVNLLGMDRLKLLAKFVSYYGLFVCYYNIAKKFNKGVGFAILTLLFPYVCIPILGMSKYYVYDASVPVSGHAFFGTKNEDENDNKSNDKNTAYCSECGKKVNKKDNDYCTNCGKKIRK